MPVWSPRIQRSSPIHTRSFFVATPSGQQRNHSPGEPSAEHMQPLLTSFAALKKCFADDKRAIQIINREMKRADHWVVENAEEEPERACRELGDFEAPDQPRSARSIFDEVDA